MCVGVCRRWGESCKETSPISHFLPVRPSPQSLSLNTNNTNNTTLHTTHYTTHTTLSHSHPLTVPPVRVSQHLQRHRVVKLGDGPPERPQLGGVEADAFPRQGGEVLPGILAQPFLCFVLLLFRSGDVMVICVLEWWCDGFFFCFRVTTSTTHPITNPNPNPTTSRSIPLSPRLSHL